MDINDTPLKKISNTPYETLVIVALLDGSWHVYTFYYCDIPRLHVKLTTVVIFSWRFVQ